MKRKGLSASTILKMLYFLEMFAFVLATPIIRSGENLVYKEEADPLMPLPHYPNEKLVDTQVNYPFIAINNTLGNVVTGDHTVGYDPGNGWYAKCFNFEQLVKILMSCIDKPSASSLVNYTQPACNTTSLWTGVYDGLHTSFDSALYGLSEHACRDYKNQYNARVNHCMDTAYNRASDEAILIFGCIIAAAVGLLMFATSCKAILDYHARRAENARDNAEVAPLVINNPQTFMYNRLNPAQNNTQHLSNTPGITPQLKFFLEGIERSPYQVNDLPNATRDLLEEKKTLCCTITQSLMSMPVLLDGRSYDFQSLVDLPNFQGIRKDPITRADFRLNEIQANRDIREAVETLIRPLKNTLHQ